MPKLNAYGRSYTKPKLKLTPQTWRVPNRAGGVYQDASAWARSLKPIGRPNDIYGDVLVTLSRVKAMESH